MYRDVGFNGNTGCIVGQNGSILISHDRGETWKPSGTFYKNEIRELMQLRSVQFVTPRQGYAVGELGSRIMYTEDGGQNWTYRTTGQQEWLRALWAGPDGKLTVVGEREKILESTDHGLSWEQLHGKQTKIDIMVLMAHGDDAPLRFNAFYAHYTINEDKSIVDVEIISDLHSSEYEETYNLEHDRNTWMIGAGTSTNFVQFENGNNGANYYHYTQRLWEGEENIDRQMVAAIRAYRPDIIITHGGILGDYDKPGHKVSGRAGLRAFETSGGPVDHWPELTRLGLEPWEPKKLYCNASESYPVTIDLSWIAEEPLTGTGMTCREYGNYVIRNFQSQGVYHHSGRLKLCLVRSRVAVPENEKSVFDGLE
jgi:LmbE family N-acetylglucosaminyl deacetylase